MISVIFLALMSCVLTMEPEQSAWESYIFYEDADICLEAAPNDVKLAPWGFKGYKTDRTLMTLGSGKANTDLLIQEKIETWSAAELCRQYRGGGYDDWFLPSYNELNKLYLFYKKTGKGNFFDDFYWSSSEYSATWARAQNFKNGYQEQSYPKDEELHVRPIRYRRVKGVKG
jgi:hypothetical protein